MSALPAVIITVGSATLAVLWGGKQVHAQSSSISAPAVGVNSTGDLDQSPDYSGEWRSERMCFLLRQASDGAVEGSYGALGQGQIGRVEGIVRDDSLRLRFSSPGGSGDMAWRLTGSDKGKVWWRSDGQVKHGWAGDYTVERRKARSKKPRAAGRRHRQPSTETTESVAEKSVAEEASNRSAKRLTPEELEQRTNDLRSLIEPRVGEVVDEARRRHPLLYEALSYNNGIAGKVDFAKVRELLEKAEMAGDKTASLFVRVLRRDNPAVSQATGTTALYKIVSAQARQRDVLAVLICGHALAVGIGCEADTQLAAKYFKWAADQGEPDAMYEWALCLSQGEGVELDPAEAAVFYKLAVDEGHARAANGLGCAYGDGYGVVRDLEKSYAYKAVGAKLGFHSAQFNLGLCYEKGTGVEQDWRLAFEWYQKAALQENTDAQNNVGHCYLNGFGIAKDYPAAVGWFQKAAQANNPNALFNLGVVYYNGQGVPANTNRGKKYLTAAADLGHEGAKAALAKLRMLSRFRQKMPSTPQYHPGGAGRDMRRFREQLSRQGVNF